MYITVPSASTQGHAPIDRVRLCSTSPASRGLRHVVWHVHQMRLRQHRSVKATLHTRSKFDVSWLSLMGRSWDTLVQGIAGFIIMQHDNDTAWDRATAQGC